MVRAETAAGEQRVNNMVSVIGGVRVIKMHAINNESLPVSWSLPTRAAGSCLGLVCYQGSLRLRRGGGWLVVGRGGCGGGDCGVVVVVMGGGGGIG
jgi:hypothetical protein